MSQYQIWHYTSVSLDAVGGVEKHILGLKNAMHDLGHSVYLGRDGSIPLHTANYNKPLIIHTHGDCWPSPDFLFGLKKRALNTKALTKWVHVCHGNTLERMLKCNKYLSFSGWKGVSRDFTLLSLSDASIAVSQHAIDETIRLYKYGGKYSVIANGADTDLFAPLKSINVRPRIIFLGRSEDHVKNVTNLLKAANSVYLGHPDLELWVAPGIDEIFPFVKNLGHLDPASLAHKLTECRALVLYSYYEGDPLVIREAMAMGLPIIASDIPAVHEAASNYPNLFVVNPNDPLTLSNAIEQALYFRSDLRPTPAPRTWMQSAREYVSFYDSL